MGFRTYFYKVEKDKLNKIKDLSVEDLKKLYPQYYDNEDGYFNKCDFRDEYLNAEEIYEFGKYGIADDICIKMSKDIECLKDDDTYYMLSNKDCFKRTIQEYVNHIVKYKKDLLNEKSEDKYDDRPQLNRLIENVRSTLCWMEHDFLAYIDQPNNKIFSSWSYEHDLANLISEYKHFDWDKYELLFLGY